MKILLFVSSLHLLLGSTAAERCDTSIFSTCPEDRYYADIHSTVDISCDIHPNLQMKKCVWVKPNNNAIMPVSDQGKYRKVGACSLKILNVRQHDIGTWQCAPLVEGLDQQRTVPTDVILKVSDETCDADITDTFHKCPKKKTPVYYGEDVTLRCATWKTIDLCAWISPAGTNIMPLPNDDKYKLVHIGTVSKYGCNLKILNVQLADVGQWTCNPMISGEVNPEYTRTELVYYPGNNEIANLISAPPAEEPCTPVSEDRIFTRELSDAILFNGEEFKNTDNSDVCISLCQDNTECKAWIYVTAEFAIRDQRKRCYLVTGYAGSRSLAGVKSGLPSSCKGCLYQNRGCFTDVGEDRAFEVNLEGTSAALHGSYQDRLYPVTTCYNAAKQQGYRVFGIEHGGECWASSGETTAYRHGASDACQDGKGGEFALDVYQVTNCAK